VSDRSADEELSCCTIARVPRLAHKEVCQFGPAFLQLALENEVPLGIDEAKIALQPSLRGDLAIALTSTRSRKMKRIALDHRHRSAVWCRQKRAGLCHCSAGCVRTPPLRGTNPFLHYCVTDPVRMAHAFPLDQLDALLLDRRLAPSFNNDSAREIHGVRSSAHGAGQAFAMSRR
jgi:hypothetical protein